MSTSYFLLIPIFRKLIPTMDPEDNRPVAVRRKRRSNSSLVDPARDTTVHENESLSENQHVSPVEVKTPTKTKKRVRFSDPGLQPPDSSSTGLTPHLRRSKLTTKSRQHSPSKRHLAEKSRARRSLPLSVSTSLPSPSLSPPVSPYFSGEVQFVPLRQALDERLKRRLRRNNMSKEINEIEAEKKSRSVLRQEVKDLKDELALAKQLGKEVGDGIDGRESGRIQDLEDELAILKQEMREKSEAPVLPSNGAIPDSITPVSSTYGDGDINDEFMIENFDGNGDIIESADERIAPTMTEATTQVSLPSPIDMTAFRSARLALEYLFPGESSLGLTIEDPGVIINKLLDHLRSLKAQTILAENAASTSKSQEANLRYQFNAVLQQLDRARTHADGLSARIVSEKARSDGLERKAQRLGIGVELGTQRVKGLEADLDEKERSIQKLQDALETYRIEVGKLETLVTKLEKEHIIVISNFKTEMKETVSDLECRVAAETTGRRAAENAAVERGERIKQLEGLESELKGAVSEKQKIIRDLERDICKEQDGREREIGSLNVQIGELTTNLQEVIGDLAKVEAEKNRLLGRVEEEKAAGIRAVDAVQQEMARCIERVENVQDVHTRDVQSRGAEVAEHRGLLTPVSACKFKDVEGYVEVRRGKAKDRKRPDSGIGILDERDEEDLMVDEIQN